MGADLAAIGRTTPTPPCGSVMIGRPLVEAIKRSERELVSMESMSCRSGSARSVVVLLLIGAMLGLAGCGSNGSSVATNGSTTTTIDPADAQVLDAYRAFQQDYMAIGASMNLDDPRLKAHATGDELKQLTKTFVGMKLEGYKLTGSITTSPKLVSRTDTSAVVRDCAIDAGQMIDGSGKIVGDPATTMQLLSADLVFEDATWKVAKVHDEGTGCDPKSF